MHNKGRHIAYIKEQELELTVVPKTSHKNLPLRKCIQHHDFAAVNCQKHNPAPTASENVRALQVQVKIQ